MSSRVAEIVDRQHYSRRADIPCTNMAQLAEAAHSGAPPPERFCATLRRDRRSDLHHVGTPPPSPFRDVRRTPRAMTPSPSPSSIGGSILTDGEIAERVMRMLRMTPLFAGMSWRLIADLVRAFPPQRVGDATNRTPLDFALLAVPEHTLLLSDESHEHPPLASPPSSEDVVELTRGIHMRHHPHIRRVPMEKPTIEAPRGRIVRYYALKRGEIRTLPTHVLRAMNFAALPPDVTKEII